MYIHVYVFMHHKNVVTLLYIEFTQMYIRTNVQRVITRTSEY